MGPCIPDLKVRLGLNYEEISRAFIGPSISIVIGAVIGGVLHQRFQRLSPLFFAFGNIVGAVGKATIFITYKTVVFVHQLNIYIPYQ